MTLIEQAKSALKSKSSRLILPEADDQRVVEAAAELRDVGMEVLHPDMTADPAPFIAHLQNRKPEMTDTDAAALLQEPTMRGAAMLALGHGDLLVSGAATPTATVIRAGLRAVGIAPGTKLACSSFLMQFPGGRDLMFADCAVNLSPDAEQLAQIGAVVGAAAQGLFGEAKIALLSYSTGQSGSGPSVDIVQAAAKTLQDAGANAQGPIQADAALNTAIGAKKGIENFEPNVLIFPDLNAGNIGYKLCQELGGVQALGPFLHGFARPMADLSRGATVSDIVNTSLLTAMMA